MEPFQTILADSMFYFCPFLYSTQGIEEKVMYNNRKQCTMDNLQVVVGENFQYFFPFFKFHTYFLFWLRIQPPSASAVVTLGFLKKCGTVAKERYPKMKMHVLHQNLFCAYVAPKKITYSSKISAVCRIVSDVVFVWNMQHR